jgi:hypothetical protein
MPLASRLSPLLRYTRHPTHRLRRPHAPSSPVAPPTRTMRMTRSKSRRSSRSSRSAGEPHAYAEESDSDDAEEGKAGRDVEAPSFIVVYPSADKKKNGRKIAIDRSMDPIVRRHCRLCCRLCCARHSMDTAPLAPCMLQHVPRRPVSHCIRSRHYSVLRVTPLSRDHHDNASASPCTRRPYTHVALLLL